MSLDGRALRALSDGVQSVPEAKDGMGTERQDQRQGCPGVSRGVQAWRSCKPVRLWLPLGFKAVCPDIYVVLRLCDQAAARAPGTD